MANTIGFEPKYMKMSILTAALQELTPREVRDNDPDKAIVEWLDYAKEIGVDSIQLSAALHPSVANVPEEAMLDPVANHLDLRQPFTKERAERVAEAVRRTGVDITEIGYFDDMLIADNELRQQKHNFELGVLDAAVLLREAGVGIEAIVGFVGRNQTMDMDQNLAWFEKVYIPQLKVIKEKGFIKRHEQCPMPGWNTYDTFINNITHVPGMWIRLYEIAKKHGVGDEFRVTYDASHALLMGQRTEQIFRYLNEEGYDFLIDAFHAKGQVINQRVLAEWGYHGQQVDRGDRHDGKPSDNPADLGNAWKKMGHTEHELPGTAEYNPIAMIQGLQEDWLLHQLSARKYLSLDPEKTLFVVEHEYPLARVQDKDELLPILQGSIAYIRAIDQAAGNMVALHQVLESQRIPIQKAGYLMPQK